MSDRAGPPPIGTVLLDLDGVVRHFDPAHQAEVERANGLAPGTLAEAAFEPSLLDRLVTGRLTRAAWTTEVGRLVDSPAAATSWLAERGSVDHELLAVVDRIRGAGRTVAILTNGTDTIEAELVELGVRDRFDAVFNSADIGVPKPDPRAFLHCCVGLDVEPSSVFFTDDSPAKLAGALEIGMVAEVYRGVAPLRRRLAGLLSLPELLDR